MTKHTGNSYLDITKKYAASQEQQPFTLYFERPGFLAFLPTLSESQNPLFVILSRPLHSF